MRTVVAVVETNIVVAVVAIVVAEIVVDVSLVVMSRRSYVYVYYSIERLMMSMDYSDFRVGPSGFLSSQHVQIRAERNSPDDLPWSGDLQGHTLGEGGEVTAERRFKISVSCLSGGCCRFDMDRYCVICLQGWSR